MAIVKNQIKKEHLILCEGRDALEFFIAFLNSEELSYRKEFSNDIQVFDFGGNEQLERFLELLRLRDNFNKVKSILIIRDAENDAQKAQNEVKHALQKHDFSVPEKVAQWKEGTPKIGFLLFPTCSEQLENGTLEDLCLSILKEEQSPAILEEIDNFLNLLNDKHQRKFPHIFKSKLHTYFSVTDDFVSLKIGEAARAGAFEWGHKTLGDLRSFIEEIFAL